MDYKQLLGGFSRLGKPVTDLSRISRLMAVIGDPQKKLRFVHIAGTNGKGSTAQMIADTLTSAGCRTGLFTSPFILRYNDRIRVDGAEITDSELDAAAEEVAAALARSGSAGEFSQFEITQAMGLLHFVNSDCDIVVLEAGLGGLLDSTNVIPPPLVSVITSVSLDHTEILGSSLADIARHKAGIIKQGSRAVAAAGIPDEAAKIIAESAKMAGVPLTIPDTSRLDVGECTPFGSRFRYCGREYRVAMGGAHQINNALTVIETISVLRDELEMNIPEGALDRGLSAQVPARLQVVSRDPLIIVDGGHNPEGVGALCDAVDSLKESRITAIVGMMRDKDSAAAAGRLVGSFDKFICVDGFSERALPSESLERLLKSAGARETECCTGLSDALRRYTAAGGTLVICGSLYLASEALGSGQLLKIRGE